MKILIVDDSNIIRNRVARVMELARLSHFKVVGAAGDGVEAIKMFNQTAPDIVTMDLTMPEMDGVACTAALVDLNPDIKILIVSALNDKATAINALKNGAQGFLYKPFTDDELADALLEIAQ
jgi:two-component system, chemotaxis family, chemotaxis protein CheY